MLLRIILDWYQMTSTVVSRITLGKTPKYPGVLTVSLITPKFVLFVPKDLERQWIKHAITQLAHTLRRGTNWPYYCSDGTCNYVSISSRAFGDTVLWGIVNTGRFTRVVFLYESTALSDLLHGWDIRWHYVIITLGDIKILSATWRHQNFNLQRLQTVLINQV